MASLKSAHDTLKKVREQLKTSVVGADDIITQLLVAILADGHALLESVPGLGKTTMIKSLADTMHMSFSRIQNTPDLLPSDVLGTQIINQSGGKTSFTFQEGPIFANVVLADEINRATPKTQAAMLEVMQEKQVTVYGETYEMDQPFFVLATQNPIDQEGTYPLPEAQTDRFLLKINVDYPEAKDEQDIVKIYATKSGMKKAKIKPVVDANQVITLQGMAEEIPISTELANKCVQIVRATREDNKYISVGASPRASIGLVKAARAHALINGRPHVNKEDIQAMALPVLRHRIMLAFEAERDGKSADDIIKEIAQKTLKK